MSRAARAGAPGKKKKPGKEEAEALPKPELTVEERIVEERAKRKSHRRAERAKEKYDLLQEIGVPEYSDDALTLEVPFCVWRDRASNELLEVLAEHKRRELEEEVMEQKLEDDEHRLVKRKTFMPAAKLNALLGHWMKLFYVSCRKAIAVAHRANSTTASSGASGSDSTSKLPESVTLPTTLVAERGRAAKGDGRVIFKFLVSLLESLEHFKYVPRVCLFCLICGLFPEHGWHFSRFTGMLFTRFMTLLSREAPSFTVETYAKTTTCWVSGDAVSSVLRHLFGNGSSSGDNVWYMRDWESACAKARVPMMWNDESVKRDLQASIAATSSLVGKIDPKDRRLLPPELKNSGFNTVIIDVDKCASAVLSAWLDQRNIVADALEQVERRRTAKQRFELETIRAAVQAARDRPFSRYEVRALKRGVQQHGIGAWEDILEDDRLIFVHRTPGRLKHEWEVIADRRERRERRRWDWRKWPWNPEWEWGALVISDEPDVLDTFEDEWEAWDDGDGAGDADDAIMDDSSAYTLTDSEEEDEKEFQLMLLEEQLEATEGSEPATGASGPDAVATLAAAAAAAAAAASTTEGAGASAEGTGVTATHGSDNAKAKMTPSASAPSLQAHADASPGPRPGSQQGTALSSSVTGAGMLRNNGWQHHTRSHPDLPKMARRLSSTSSRERQNRPGTALRLGHYSFGDLSAVKLSAKLGGKAVEPMGNTLDAGAQSWVAADALRDERVHPSGSVVIDTLVLRDNNLTGKGFAALAESMVTNHQLTLLDLRHNKLGRTGINALSRVLRGGYCRIEALDLDSNGVADEQLFMICTALHERAEHPAQLQAPLPKIGENKGQDQVEGKDTSTVPPPKVAPPSPNPPDEEAFPSPLMELVLSHNELTDACGPALQILFRGAANLRYLDLSWNYLRSAAAELLAEALVSSRSPLAVLNLQFNTVGSTGAAALLAALQNSACRISSLDMSFNGINGEQILDATVELVHSPTRCTSLMMNGNEWSDGAIESIRNAQAARQDRGVEPLEIGVATSAVLDEEMAALIEKHVPPDSRVVSLAGLL